MLKHMDGVHMVLHFLFDSFAQQVRNGLREISIFGEGLYIWVQFLQNFSSAKLAEVCTIVLPRNNRAC